MAMVQYKVWKFACPYSETQHHYFYIARCIQNQITNQRYMRSCLFKFWFSLYRYTNPFQQFTDILVEYHRGQHDLPTVDCWVFWFFCFGIPIFIEFIPNNSLNSFFLFQLMIINMQSTVLGIGMMIFMITPLHVLSWCYKHNLLESLHFSAVWEWWGRNSAANCQ